MRLQFLLPLTAVALAACGSEPPAPTSADDVVAEMKELTRPMPGLYRSSSELVSFEVPGLSEEQSEQMKGQMSGLRGETQERCLTQEEADKGFEDMIRQISEGQNGLSCNFSKFEADGSALDAALSCDGPGGTDASIALKGTVEETRSDLNMDMTMSAGPLGEMKMKLKTESERIGDC